MHPQPPSQLRMYTHTSVNENTWRVHCNLEGNKWIACKLPYDHNTG